MGCFLGIKGQGSEFLRLKGGFFRLFLLAFIDAYFRKKVILFSFFPFPLFNLLSDHYRLRIIVLFLPYLFLQNSEALFGGC